MNWQRNYTITWVIISAISNSVNSCHPVANFHSRLSKIHLSESRALAFILVACLLLVALTIKSYGASYDEVLIHEYANNNVRAYINLVFYKPIDPLTDFYNLQYYGPAVWVISRVVSVPIAAVFPALDAYDAWHIVNFAIFLLGVWCLYCLARRFASPRAALAAALLYLTQPLLWGHGVMNSKDIPFMTFFLATVLAGVRMAEEIAKPSQPPARKLSLFKGRRKYLSWPALVVSGLSLVDLVTNHLLSRPLVSAIINHAYEAGPGDLLHKLFTRLAANAGTISATAYIDKAIQLVNVAEFAIAGLAFLGLAAAWPLRTSSRNRWIVLAGVTAGLTVSVRVLGPAAMGLVGLYGLARAGRKVVKPLLAYVGLGILVTWASWPYLWADPLARFTQSLGVMANFPWEGTVTFEGTTYAANALPWYYLPKLIGIQLTLPALGLAAAGLVISAIWIVRHKIDWRVVLIPVLWFFLPLAAVLLLHPTMYDNFRQFLFILPPLFLFAAAAIDTIFQKLRPAVLATAICLALLIPGIAAGAWLHPYEYVYFNALVGWTGGVGRAYETDYWFTSMCEMGREVSSVAPENARIAFTDDLARTLFERCTDKRFQLFYERSETDKLHPEYSVVSSRFGDDQEFFRNMPVIYTSGRGNTIFSVVKKAP